jgi:hypothetical protein
MIFLYVPLEITSCRLFDGVLNLSFKEYGTTFHVRETAPGVEALYDKIVHCPAQFIDLYNQYREAAGLPRYDRLQFLSFLDAELKEVQIICRESILDARLFDWKRQNPEDIRKELAHDRLLKEKKWLEEKRV